MSRIRMDENGVEALKNLAMSLPETIQDVNESTKQLRETFEQNKELLGPHSAEIETILESVDEAQKIGSKSVLQMQKKLIAAAAMLAAIIDNGLGTATADGNSDVNTSNVVKDVVDQNVTKSVLPSKGTWSDSARPGNSAFTIADDATVTWSKGGTHSCTGRELKEWMQSNYGTTTVTYDHKEPDFMPFADKRIGVITVDKMSTSRTGGQGTFEYATEIVEKNKGMSPEKLKQYMIDNQLTWHECADRHTIIAIPTRINSTFTHTGGISVERSVEAIGSAIYEQTGGRDSVLVKDGISGTVEKSELDKAIQKQHDRFKEKKRDLFGKK